MWRYLKEAFFAAPRIEGVGDVPLNVIGVGAFGLLGFVHPAFWVVGAIGEAAYLAYASTNKRFRKWVRAKEIAERRLPDRKERYALARKLDKRSQKRLARLEMKCGRVLEIQRSKDRDGPLVHSNTEALQKLLWIYFKLLLARVYMLGADTENAEHKLHKELRKLERQIERGDLSAAAERSKRATLEIVQQRLANHEAREEELVEVEADLERIEQQVELALESATMRSRPAAVASKIELASHVLDLNLFADDVALDVQRLDDSLEAETTGDFGSGVFQ